jgi:excisionase family DNA binding protein
MPRVSANVSQLAPAPENSSVSAKTKASARATYARHQQEAAVASPAMTLAEAAAYLRCGVGAVRRLCYAKKLSWQLRGKHWVVKRSEVEELLEKGWNRAETIR